MIISEKQIMQLLYFTGQYRNMLLLSDRNSALTEDGKNELKTIGAIVSSIVNQQSDKLKEISDE